jgi:hypothetical protein
VPLVFYLGRPTTDLHSAWISTAIVSTAVLGILLLANRRHQFGVRAFMLAVAALSLLFAMLSTSIDKSRKERETILAITALGGTCVNAHGLDPELVWIRTPLIDRGITTVQSVKLGNSKARNSDLALLQPFTDLAAVDISNTAISDEGLKHLIGHTKLERLWIGGSGVTTDGVIELFSSQGRSLVEALAAIGFAVHQSDDETITKLGNPDWDAICSVINRPELSKLQSLDVAVSKVTDRDLARLHHLKDLRSLETMGTAVTFSGVKRFFVELQGRDITDAMVAYGWSTLPGHALTHTLYCQHDRVKDADLQEIGQLVSLEVLLLDSTDITDAGIKHLANLTQLQRLFLRNTQVTGVGLKQLAGLTRLKSLDLSGSRQITSDALQELPNREKLMSLNLCGTEVDSKGLPHLRTMTDLVQLRISSDAGSEANFSELRSALPNTSVEIYQTGL